MVLEKEREQIVIYCKKMIEHQLTKGTGGNISIYHPESGLMAISPSGMDYFQMESEDVVVLDLNGNIIEGRRNPCEGSRLPSRPQRVALCVRVRGWK